MPDLILGMIENANKKYVEPFLNSLRASGYKDDIVLFGNNVSNDAKEFLVYHKVKFIRYRAIGCKRKDLAIELFNWLLKQYGKLFCWNTFPKREAIIKLLWGCKLSRYYLYADFLHNSPVKYDKILLCDVRDTVFQRYPFPEELKSSLYFFEEYPFKISQRPFNYNCVRAIFGKDALDQLGDKTIICSGIILGTLNGIKLFLSSMKSVRFQYPFINGDQAAVNYLVYNNLLVDVKLVPFGEGQVMHIGTAPREKIHITQDGEVLCNNGNVCPIVHQYDRHADIQANFLKRYS